MTTTPTTMQEIERLLDMLGKHVRWYEAIPNDGYMQGMVNARAALLDAVRRVVEDAERYRWLRSQRTAAMHKEGWQIRRHWREQDREHSGQPTPGLDSVCLSKESLDTAIDAARSEGKQP